MLSYLIHLFIIFLKSIVCLCVCVFVFVYNSQDPTLPGRVLEYNIENGSWCKLKSSVEDILLHAAFMICPNVLPIMTTAAAATTAGGGSSRGGGGGGGEENKNRFEDSLIMKDMGHAAFKCYIKTLQAANSESLRREITRSRFRSALILATPYSLAMQAEGVYTVKDLISSVNLPKYAMPPIYQAQIESLLTVAVAKSCKSKAARPPKNYESS